MSLYDDFKKLRSQKRLSPEQQLKEDERNASEQRQKLISYKKFFGEPHMREVMLDLMNKYYVLTKLPETTDLITLARAEGKREVVLDLLTRANVSMEQLDKLLKGEFV